MLHNMSEASQSRLVTLSVCWNWVAKYRYRICIRLA